MYLSYYRLTAKPFQISTNPRFLWLGSDHKEALAGLKYGLLEGNGYVVLIGAVGTGKTTLVNALLQTLDENVLTAVINHPTLDTGDFFSFLVRTFDPTAQVAGKTDALHFLQSFLRRVYTNGKTALLVIDEAHQLSEALLEEIRLLSNMELDGEKLITIFFVGQTELKRKLQSPQCQALRQRITVFHHLQPLSEADTGHYIDHRLKLAGATANLFTRDAVRAVFRFSRGYPRIINKVCDRALLTGYVKERDAVDAAIVSECAREISVIDPIRSDDPSFAKRPRSGRGKPDQPPVSAPFIHLRTTAAALVHHTRSALRRRAQTVRANTAAILQGRRRWVLAATGAAAIVIVAGWVAGFQPEQPQPIAQAPPVPARTTQEDIQAYYSPGEPQTAHATNSPLETGPSSSPAVIQSASAPSMAAAVQPQEPVKAPAPIIPSKAEIAAALLARNDYTAVIELYASDSAAPANQAQAAHLYAQALVGRAGQLMAQSPEEAETLLHAAATADPLNIEALVQLGNLYTRTKAYTKAVDYFQKAVDIDPQRADVLFNLGYILASTGMYESAEEMLTRVVQLKPPYVDKALFNLAVVQQTIGKHEASLASLAAAVAIRPENKQARAYLEELKADRQER